MERTRDSKTASSLSEHIKVTEKHLISAQSVAFTLQCIM
jgi:hypothetical protein